MHSPRAEHDTTAQLMRDDAIIVRKLRIASSMLSRMRGLLGRTALDPNEGLWITPCTSIHMMFMRFAIDAVFIDNHQQIVRIHECVKPWRLARGGRGARSVLELPAGTVTRHTLTIGDRLRIVHDSDATM